MTASVHRPAPDFAAIEAEHRLQVSLVVALEEALEKGDGALAGRLLVQLRASLAAHIGGPDRALEQALGHEASGGEFDGFRI